MSIVPAYFSASSSTGVPLCTSGLGGSFSTLVSYWGNHILCSVPKAETRPSMGCASICTAKKWLRSTSPPVKNPRATQRKNNCAVSLSYEWQHQASTIRHLNIKPWNRNLAALKILVKMPSMLHILMRGHVKPVILPPAKPSVFLDNIFL